MEYLFKSSVIIILFYGLYKILLQSDTFFESNRLFFLTGIICALIIPLITIPIYITIEPQNISSFIIEGSNSGELTSTENKLTFNWVQLLTIIYFLGVLIFSIKLCVQLFSLTSLLLRNKKQRSGKFIYVKVKDNISPFSFFNWIVFNPKQFKKEELDQIITHEKVHASQYHSIDMLLTQIASVIFWFNPFIWLYEKAIQQNLEFIADAETQKLTYCEKTYQQLLLKTSVPNYQMVFTNNFFNSLIKKRIVMLHKSKSRKRNQWKYIAIIPLLVLFLMSFSTENVYVNALNSNPRFTVSAETDSHNLKIIEKALSNENLKLKFTDLIRNEKGEIQRISINTKYKKDKRFIKRMTLNNNLKVEAIEPFNLSYNEKENKIDFSFSGKESTSLISSDKISFSGENSITTIKSPKSISSPTINFGDIEIAIITKEMTKSQLEDLKSQFKELGVTLKFNGIKRNDKNEIIAISISASSKKSKAKIEVDSDKPISQIIVKYDSDEETISVQNTSKDSNGMHFVNKDKKHTISTHGKGSNVFTFSNSDDNETHDIIIESNGKKSKIKRKTGSVHVISNYDEDDKIIELDNDDGNIIIRKSKDGKIIKKATVKSTWTDDDESTIILNNDSDNNVFISTKGDENPLIILDGKQITYDEFKALKPNTIKTRNIIKGDRAKEEYGEKGKNGVINITTKN